MTQPGTRQCTQLTAILAEQQEKKTSWKMLQHLVGSKHDCPSRLTMEKLLYIIETLKQAEGPLSLENK